MMYLVLTMPIIMYLVDVNKLYAFWYLSQELVLTWSHSLGNTSRAIDPELSYTAGWFHNVSDSDVLHWCPKPQFLAKMLIQKYRCFGNEQHSGSLAAQVHWGRETWSYKQVVCHDRVVSTRDYFIHKVIWLQANLHSVYWTEHR